VARTSAFSTAGTLNKKIKIINMNEKIFDSFACTSSGRRAARLLATHQVTPKQIFDAALAETTQAMPNVQDERKYTTEQLCGPACWARWYTAERRVAGMCMAYFVRAKVILMEPHVTRSGKGTRKYYLPLTQSVIAKALTRSASVFTIAGLLP
jgi:hypothetical protein